MESVFFLFYMVFLFGVVSLAVSAAKKKDSQQKKSPQNPPQRTAQSKKPAAPANTAFVSASEPQVLSFEEFERDGSIDMPAPEPHEHEGKPLPCPAEERQKPRPRPAQMAPKAAPAPNAGVQLAFSKNSLVQAVVMAEILKRPRFENGRRVIR